MEFELIKPRIERQNGDDGAQWTVIWRYRHSWYEARPAGVDNTFDGALQIALSPWMTEQVMAFFETKNESKLTSVQGLPYISSVNQPREQSVRGHILKLPLWLKKRMQ